RVLGPESSGRRGPGGLAMNPARRVALAASILALGFGAQAALESATATDRPLLKRPLAEIPKVLGGWVGKDEAMDPQIMEESQADDSLNRVYEDRRHPGRRISLWINYSRHGLNLRHSPEICLPSSGWTKVESQTKVVAIPRDGGTTRATRLGYVK